MLTCLEQFLRCPQRILSLTMKAIKLSIVLACLFTVSCKKEVQVIRPEVIKGKIDSIVNVRFRELDANAQRDLDYRITIELRVKADSIYNARLKAAPAVKATQPNGGQ